MLGNDFRKRFQSKLCCLPEHFSGKHQAAKLRFFLDDFCVPDRVGVRVNRKLDIFQIGKLDFASVFAFVEFFPDAQAVWRIALLVHSQDDSEDDLVFWTIKVLGGYDIADLRNYFAASYEHGGQQFLFHVHIVRQFKFVVHDAYLSGIFGATKKTTLTQVNVVLLILSESLARFFAFVYTTHILGKTFRLGAVYSTIVKLSEKFLTISVKWTFTEIRTLWKCLATFTSWLWVL